MTDRLQRLRRCLAEQNYPALLISKPENRFYISGFTGSSGWVLITANESFLLTDFRYLEQAQRETSGFTVTDAGNDVNAALLGILEEKQLSSLAFESEHITFHQYQNWQNKYPQITLQPVSGIVEKLRVQKDAREIDLLKRAAVIADRAFEHIIKLLKPGIKELDVALEIEFFMRQQGAKEKAFDTIVASGIRSSLPHGVASEKVLASGDFVVLDFGAVYQGYHSDMTRTVVIGRALQEQKRLYSLVLEAQKRALTEIKAGIKCAEPDKVARNLLARAGYEQEFGHSLGHGVGLAIHEEPRLASNSTTLLASGMAVTVEPGVYISGFGGVRIEDLVIVTADGYDNLTHATKELLEL